MPVRALRIFLHPVVWLVVYLFPYWVKYGTISPEAIMKEPGVIIHFVSTALLIGYAYCNFYLFVPKLYLQKKYLLYAIAVIICVLIVIRFPQVFHSMEQGRPATLPPGQQAPDIANSREGGPTINYMSYNIILFVICTFASISIRQQRKLLEIQREKLRAELSFLKAQINPHFLFNTLNSIYALSIRKSDDTPKAITQLSELMRYILKDSNADTVPLDKELIYISNYVALQKQRLGNTVQISYSAPAENVHRQIAPLILMSFVENAFKHGVNPSQDSAIHIYITVRDEQLHFTVVNNKVTSINREEAMGIGLKNATSRLAHLYPGKHKLTIKDDEKTFSVYLIIYLHD